MEKKESVKYVDDGRTIADMSADWMPWNSGYMRRGKYARPEKRKLSKAEKKGRKKDVPRGGYCNVPRGVADSFMRIGGVYSRVLPYKAVA